MKNLEYRAICPICNRVFNSKFGNLLDGKVVCPICFTKHSNYNEYLPLESNEGFPMMTNIDYED